MKRAAITIVGLATILILTLLVFNLPLANSLGFLAKGAFGDKFAIARTILKTVPLTLTGLGILVAWRAGMYNIGGEGQFIVGGIAGAWMAKSALQANLPAPAITVLILVACMAGGAGWAGIAAWMQVKRGVEVVISTILLNFVAIQLLNYVAAGPLQEAKKQLPLTDLLPAQVMLPKFDRQTDLHAGIFIVLAAVALVYVYLFLTKGGFRLRLVGENPRVARANLVNAHSVQFRAMLLSGALCGLAAGVEYTALAGQLGAGFSQNWGFLAIPVALLSNLHPLLLLLSALYFGALFSGSENLARFTTAGTTLIYVIQAAAVLGFVALRSIADKKPVQTEAA